MIGERWRVAGLAAPRSDWFFELARWSTAAAIPVDFVKCVSADEMRTRLAGGEVYSALLVGADAGGLDRALVDEAADRGAAVILVGDAASGPQPALALGAAAALPHDFGRDELISALSEHAPPVSAAEGAGLPDGSGLAVGWQGRLIVVTGSGGTGASLLAMALAQGFAADASNRGLVLLADLALHADQALMHDSRDITCGLHELAEACHAGWIGRDRLRDLVYEPSDRGYHLLLGLRRHREWATVRRRPLETALGGLARTYRFVIADCDADTEGEADSGSSAIEDRNRLARTAAARSDLVAVAGSPGMLGLHSLVRTILSLADFGVDAGRLLPVVNRAPRRPRARAGIASALSELVENTAAEGLTKPVFVAEHRGAESALRDGVALPSALGRRLAAAVASRLRAT